jgi:hypothetical protein
MQVPSAVPTVGRLAVVLLACATFAGSARAVGAPDPLLAIDQHRASVVERIVAAWGAPLAQSSAAISIDELRSLLEGLRADHLLAASLAGTLDGVRDVLANAMVASSTTKPSLRQTKALGDKTIDSVYTPVTPCRLVETRGAFSAVYQGNGTAAHTPLPFGPNEIRTYTIQGGNGVCLSQLPGGLAPSAVQLQVFGMPTSSASGDIEILPQGAAFGTTATMVYVGSIAFNTVSTAARINPANNQISVQVRGGGAHVAIDVVGYFKSSSQGDAMNIVVNGQRVMRFERNVYPNVVGGYEGNTAVSSQGGQTIAGGGGTAVCDDPPTSGSRPCTNATTGIFATIGGGSGNRATDYATVAGGISNSAYGSASSIPGGYANSAIGFGSAVLGGSHNSAAHDLSVVAGHDAIASHDNAFVWNGWSSGIAGSFRPNSFQMHGENELSIEYGSRRIDGGGTSWVLIGSAFPGQAIATSTGAYLGTDGMWHDKSDRNSKRDVSPVDSNDILARVTALPISTWRHIDEPSGTRHLGPMAQDFFASFGLGSDDKTIGTIDEGGVALAAIQALHELLRTKDTRIAALEAEMAAQHERLASQQRELERLKHAVDGLRGTGS